MKLFKHKTISKNYALKAALYRRIAKSMNDNYDFSLHSLEELYHKETFGKGPSFNDIKYYNGYAYGKWLRDQQVSDMISDVKGGYFCKHEFLNNAIQRIHNTSILKDVVVSQLFPFDSGVYQYIKSKYLLDAPLFNAKYILWISMESR